MALVDELPSNWYNLGAEEKINWFNDNGVTVSELANAGVPAEDIGWMLNNGYSPPSEPVYTPPVEPPIVYTPPVYTPPVYYEPEPVYQEPYVPPYVPPPPPVEPPPVVAPVVTEPVRNQFPAEPEAPAMSTTYNVFGLQWDPNSSLATKQGYIDTLLSAGVTPEQLKAKIAELDPANATQQAYDLLGIPSAPTQAPANGGLLGGETQAPVQTVTPPVYDVFGTQWNTAADLATKQGYVQQLLNSGRTKAELRSYITNMDPTNATPEAFAMLGLQDAPLQEVRNPSQDAVTLMAGQLGLGLPAEWQYFTGQDKVNWFNANNITADMLRQYKVPEFDIQQAVSLGLGQTGTAAPPTWKLPAGMTLPSDWNVYTGDQKIAWFNQNKITADMLRSMGVPESDVLASIQMGLGQTTPTTPKTPTTPTTPTTFDPSKFLPPTYNLPATNFIPFASGGGQTSLAAPTSGFFYKTTPTPEVPFQFQSGAAGYTNLRPMTLEFGVPANVSQVQQFQPGPFNRSGLIANYDWAKTDAQLAQQAAQKPSPNTDISQGGAMGGKIVGFTDYEQKPSGEVGYEKGGKIRSLLGPNPDGPDEGYAKLQRGEYVVRKKAVNKYGEDFLEALNEARLPKSKLKSLL